MYLSQNIFAIEPKSHIIPMEHNLEHAPLTQDSYKIYNIGYVDVNVDLIIGTSSEWQTIVEQNTISPGQTIIFDNVGKLFQVSGVKITNKSDERAIVSCTKSDHSLQVVQEIDVFNTHLNKHLRDTYSIGVKYIPYISEKYSGLYNAFWPSDKLNVWEEILIKLQPLLKENILQTLSAVVKKRMQSIQQKLKTLSIRFDERNSFEIYMEIAKDLLGFEEKLTLTKSDDDDYNLINMFLLPLFSNFVLVKATFYALGIITSSDIGFSADDVSRIDNNLKTTVKDADEYINTLFEVRLGHAYSTSHPEDLFNSMMNTRSYVAIHGMEFTRIWGSILGNPFTGGKVFNNVISYSTFFGRATPNLIREATSRRMYPPLTPLYIGFIYNYLVSVEVYLLPQSRKIGGMKVVFADYSSYVMGTRTGIVAKVDFEGAHIAKLRVTGKGAIDSCTFYMSDGRTLPFGVEGNDSEEEIFELRDHRIVSIFLSSDSDSLGGQAANIAVSYRLNSVWE